MCGDTPLDETRPWIVEFITNVMTTNSTLTLRCIYSKQASPRCCNELYFMSVCHC